MNPKHDPMAELADSVAPLSAPDEIPEDERHPCFECDGSGLYKGHRVHQEKQHCFACKGKGYFRTSAFDRLKRKQSAAKRKEREKEEAQAAFIEANPGLIEGLREIAGWHQFAGSLMQSFDRWHSLTDNQVSAGFAALAKVAAKRAERDAAQAKKSGTVGVEAIETLFATARGNGLKRPQFITKHLRIAAAPIHGTNAGALYVKANGVYAGKIVSGEYKPTREAPDNVLELLREIAASPVEAARAYGRDTGICSCCGRTLTDPESVAAGIGPICAGKWGF